MTDFSSLQSKVNDLKAKVEQNSITPSYLGALLDDFIVMMKAIDTADMDEAVQSAVSNATEALSTAKSALAKADSAGSLASSAANGALVAVKNASDALEAASSALAAASAAQSTADSAIEKIEDLAAAKGVPGGLASLGADGHVPEGQMPRSVYEVAEFEGFCAPLGAPAFEVGSPMTGRVLFCRSTGTFVCLSAGKYYISWPGYERFGEASAQGAVPTGRRIYVDVTAHRLYHWTGTAMELTGSGLVLGDTAGTAYSGAAGKQLAENLATLGEKHDALVDREESDRTQIRNLGNALAGKLDRLDWQLEHRQLNIAGIAISTSGSIIGYGGYACSGFLPVNRDFPVVLNTSAKVLESILPIAFFDSELRHVAATVHEGADSYDATAPAEAAYYCVSCPVSGFQSYVNAPTQEGVMYGLVRVLVSALGGKVNKSALKKYALLKDVAAELQAVNTKLGEKAGRTELSNIIGNPTEGELEALDPTLVSTALRKVPQALTPEEQAQVKENLGVSKLELFIDMWNQAWKVDGVEYGRYDPENAPDAEHPFMGNEIWMTYEEALESYRCSSDFGNTANYAVTLLHGDMRTNIPIVAYTLGATIAQSGCKKMEVLALTSTHRMGTLNLKRWVISAMPKLKKIVGTLRIGALEGNNFDQLPLLEEMELDGLKTNLFLGSSPLLSLHSFQYMITNAANTSPITITVHADVYAKLTDEANTEWRQVLVDAAARNITFATA